MLFSVVVYCQEASDPEDFIKNALNLTPVSPEASSLGKYGDIPVNLAVGKINYTVPLYTIKLKDFEWPIYLSYNYSGLLVEQDPSTLGLGWDMIASGRISREIRGIPDERDSSNFMENYVTPYLNGDYDNHSISEQRALKFVIYNNIANRNFSDGQYDKYHISSGAISGSYYLKNKTDAIFSGYRNYLVAKVDNGFIITDDKGVKYFFEENEKGEHKLNIAGDSAELYVPISYLLTKIELPTNGGEIIFEYAQESHSYVRESIVETTKTGLDRGNSIFNNESVVEYKPLRKIVFPKGEVSFVTSGPYLHNTTTSFSVEEVKITNNDNNEIVEYQFTYNDVSINRKILKEVVKTSNNITEPFYTFNYNNEEIILDNINYTAQDFWGYYNSRGATSLHAASREIDYNKTVLGALEKITYPTGGYTEISYEQNVLPNNNNNDCDYSHNQTVSNSLTNSGTFIQENLDDTVNVEPTQIVYIVAYAKVDSGNFNHAFGAEAEIYVNFSGGTQCANVNLENSFSLLANVESHQQFRDRDHQIKRQYSFTGSGQIHITGNINPGGKEASIGYSISYEEPDSDKNIASAGIRVSSTKDCNNETDCVTTNYKYVLEDGITSSGLTLGGTPVYSNTIYFSNRPKAEGVESGTTTYTSSRSKQPFTSYQGAAVLYNRVESFRNNGEIGKTVTTYSVASDGGTTFPFAPKKNNDWLKGKLISNSTFEKDNSEFIPVSENSMDYEEFKLNSDENTIKGLAVGRNKYRYINFAGQSGLIQGDPGDYKEDYYIDYPKEFMVVKKESNQYFDSGSTATEEDYTYNNNLMLTKTETTNSNLDVLKSVNTYPTSGRLVTENRIAAPLKVEQYKQVGSNPEEKLSTQETVYSTNHNSANLYLPEFIKTSKGSNALEDRVVYHSYDNKGNPIEVSKKDGTKIYYVWGYNQTQPIAKIENYSSLNSTQRTVVNNAVSASDADNSRCLDTDPGTCTEKTLREKLTILREAFPNAQITTFTYDPLIGVTSITDSRGQVIYYHYDDFNRLEHVKDAQGNILSKNEYNYKN